MKHSCHHDYDPDITALSERVLLTAWPALSAYHDDLVLVGGLVPRYICRPRPPMLSAVTMDVNLGIALGATAGQYGSLSSHLTGLGFKREEQRFVKTVNDVNIYLDFLTEVPGKTTGTVMVDDVPTGVFRGIDRALTLNRECVISGVDLYGANQLCRVRVCEAGPYLILKLIAFAGRMQPKDVFDLYQIALHFDGGPEAVIAAFAAERDVNSGFAVARATLAEHFTHRDASGPLRGAAFIAGENPAAAAVDEHRRIREELVSFGQLLLAAT